MRQRRPHHSQEAPGGSRSTRHARNWAGSRLLALVGVMVAALFAPIGNAAGAQPAAGTVAAGVQLKAPQRVPDFGPNVTIFDPSMPTSQIQAKFDAIWEKQRNNEMGSARYGFYFLPGTYGTDTEPLLAKVGYYTEVAGLGASPGEVQINGKIEVYNRCFDANGAPTDDTANPPNQCFALNNFWRSLSNLTINVNSIGQDGCRARQQLLGRLAGGLAASRGRHRAAASRSWTTARARPSRAAAISPTPGREP